MNRLVTLAGAILMAIGLAACSGAPSSPSAVAGAALAGGSQLAAHEPLSAADVDFISFAANAYHALAQLGIVAEHRSAHPEVKFFARQMVSENMYRLTQLRANAHGSVAQNLSLGAAHQALLGELSQTSGWALDRLYTEAMTAELPLILARFQQEASGGSSRVVREHAADYAERLTRYIELLRAITARVH